MAIYRCPQCGLILTEEEAALRHCPVCHAPLAASAPAALPPPPPTALPGEQNALLHWFIGSLLLLLLFGGGVLWVWQPNLADWLPSQERPTANLISQAPPTPAAPTIRAKAIEPAAVAVTAVSKEMPKATGKETPAKDEKITPAPSSENPKEPAPAPVSKPEAAPEAKAGPPVVAKIENPRPPEPKPQPPQPPQPAVNPEPLRLPAPDDVRVLKRPNGEYFLLSLKEGQNVALHGKVRTLRIGQINGKAILDASQLQVERILVLDRIDGGAIVKLHAPGGLVMFVGRVDGQSQLDIDAPGGKVVFVSPTAASRSGPRIDGEARVQITAKEVDFRGGIRGAQTEVHVILTRGGVLRFQELSDHSRLLYRRAAPSDPSPRVAGGRVSGTAQLVNVE